jgi:hypothetical protein
LALVALEGLMLAQVALILFFHPLHLLVEEQEVQTVIQL